MNEIDRISYYDDPNYGISDYRNQTANFPGEIYKLIDTAMTKNSVEEFPYDWEEKPGVDTKSAAAPVK